MYGGDVLEKILDAPGIIPSIPGALEGQQREELAVVGLTAEDFSGRAGAGGGTVQQGARAAVKENAEQNGNLPAAPDPEKATRAEQIHAVTIQSQIPTLKLNENEND